MPRGRTTEQLGLGAAFQQGSLTASGDRAINAIRVNLRITSKTWFFTRTKIIIKTLQYGRYLSSVGLFAADQTHETMTGQISDSMCKVKHEEAAEGAGKMADHDCTVSCVKGGSKYVLLSDGKIYQITNQTFADVEKLAGQTVKLTGEIKGDAITVSKVEAAK